MKKFIIIFLLACGGGAVAFTLYNNKAEMAEDTARAMESMAHVPVSVEKVSVRSMERNYETNGILEANQELTLMAETSGAVTKIYKRKGDFVRKGELILQIDDRLIQSELTIAKLNLEKATKDLSRFSNLSETEANTKKQFEDVETAFKIAEAQLMAIEKRAGDTQITAPIPGYINEDFYVPGLLVSPGMPLAHIIHKDPLKFIMSVPENEISNIQIGQKLPININALPDGELTGEVRYISNKSDGSFKYEVVLLIENQKTELAKPGMFGKAYFSSAGLKPALLIDRKSLSGGMKNPGVFIIENEKAKFKPVKVRPLNGSFVEITEGLNEGDEIISSGLINVKEGIKVKVQ